MTPATIHILSQRVNSSRIYCDFVQKFILFIRRFKGVDSAPKNIQKLYTGMLDKLYKSRMITIMNQKFSELSPVQTQKFLENLEKQGVKENNLNRDHTRAMTQILDFTTGWKRVRCEDFSSVPYKVKDFLQNTKDVFAAIYSYDPYKDNNFESMGLDLNLHNIESYLKFYFDYFVSGSDYLKPISFLDEIEWQDDLTPPMKQSLEKHLVEYPDIHQEKDDFTIKTLCVFRRAILVVTFFIQADGHIEIQARESLIEDLPIKNFA